MPKYDPKKVAYTDALREEIARRNREENPDAAAFVDEVRRVFGPGVKVCYVGPRRDDPPANH